MREQRAGDASTKDQAGTEPTIREIWADAARAFEDICGESLQRGDVKNFDDVQQQILRTANRELSGADEDQKDKWATAKRVGLTSLKFLKLLLGAASQASAFIPIPASAANIASSALSFVFDIPQSIKGYNDAINQVFVEVSSALSQFQIYTSIENPDPILIQKIHLVMVSFVKLCAYVVKYRQGSWKHRLSRQMKSIVDEDRELSDEMATFKRVLQQHHAVEGTVTLAVVVETQHDVAMLLEQHITFSKTTEDIHQRVQETQKGVQAIRDEQHRTETLNKIIDALGVPRTVRLDGKTTQTCTNICDRCINGTGSWIEQHGAYKAWISTEKEKNDCSPVLLVSGQPSSGKTSVCALITRRLEEQKGRTYVAHFFFPSSISKSGEKKSVQFALKYMAFQIARVDATVRTALGKSCEPESGVFRRSENAEPLDALWAKLKIGTTGSGASYYLVFDGLENLPDGQAEELLKFLSSGKMTDASAGRVHVLVSGTDGQFASRLDIVGNKRSLRIQMEEYNQQDMRRIIDEALTTRGILLHAKPDSDQKRARDKILEKLPQNVRGSYSRLQFGLNDVIRLLSTRTAIRDLDRMLDESVSSHEVAIQSLQRTLTADEIGELNELLKWVLFGNTAMTLEELEAAMFLYSNIQSLASLQYIIRSKYSAVLKLEDGFVYGQDQVIEYLQKERADRERSSLSNDRPTISMTITISNADQERCEHFLWDLAHMGIRDKFRFDFDNASSIGQPHGRRSHAVIAVDEFEANHTIVNRAFDYLMKEPSEHTNAIGKYLVCWLPYHLRQLRRLEEEDMGTLTPLEKYEIGNNLYKLFRDEDVFRRHKAGFEEDYWTQVQIKDVQKWIMDSSITRKLDKKWREEVQHVISPTRGFLKHLVTVVLEGFLRQRTWDVSNAYYWVSEFMAMDKDDAKLLRPDPNSDIAEADDTSSSSSLCDFDPVAHWNDVSEWSQRFLRLPESQLDSIWYERLAEAASASYGDVNTALTLYQRAIEKGNPSWLCYRGLGETHFTMGQTEEAIGQITLALEGTKREDAAPRPEESDIVKLHLLLGRYSYKKNDSQSAIEHYLVVSRSADPVLATQGRLEHLRAVLSLPDVEVKRQLLRNTLVSDKEEAKTVCLLKEMALDEGHNTLVSRIFIVAKEDLELLKGIVRTMEAATIENASDDDERTADERFTDDVARGVLLYDRGVAAYTYGVSSNGMNPIEQALLLWESSRSLLSTVGGRNASLVFQCATAALAKHYFQSMMNGNHAKHLDVLEGLTKSNSYCVESIGFLSALYAARGQRKESRAILGQLIKPALQILSDDMPENDVFGFDTLFKALCQCQDFENAAIALSLKGHADLVTTALDFRVKHLEDLDGVVDEQVLSLVTSLAQETIQEVRSQVPDSSQQIQRIQVAKTHVDTLLTTAEIDTKQETGSNGVKAEDNGKSDPTAPGPETIAAYRHLHFSISNLHTTHTPDLDPNTFAWSCDGCAPDGRRCANVADFVHEFYHCIYCWNKNFCRSCLARLRAPSGGAHNITACSPDHRWLQIPPQGDKYAGPKARRVRPPREVRPMREDPEIFEICYFANEEEEEKEKGTAGCNVITVEEWKHALSLQWDIPLEGLR